MNKKIIAIILEIIPIVSAILTYVLIWGPFEGMTLVSGITMLIALFGFVFFIVGRLLAKEEKAVTILGIFDILATLSMIFIFVIVFIAMGSAG